MQTTWPNELKPTMLLELRQEMVAAYALLTRIYSKFPESITTLSPARSYLSRSLMDLGLSIDNLSSEIGPTTSPVTMVKPERKSLNS